MKQDTQIVQRGAPKFVPPVAPSRILAVGWQMANQPLVIVTDEDVEQIFSSVHQTELDMMANDLEVCRNNPDSVFRLEDWQLEEIENERPGAETIAPYIAF